MFIEWEYLILDGREFHKIVPCNWKDCTPKSFDLGSCNSLVFNSPRALFGL